MGFIFETWLHVASLFGRLWGSHPVFCHLQHTCPIFFMLWAMLINPISTLTQVLHLPINWKSILLKSLFLSFNLLSTLPSEASNPIQLAFS